MLRKLASAALIISLPIIASATEYRTVERPRQECWNEQVPVQARSQDYGGAILGGIAGGLLGNQVGGGNGRTVATAVGAMTGAIVGDRVSSYPPGYQTSYQTVQRCRTVMEQVQVPVVRRPVEVIVQPVPVVEGPVYYVDQYGPPSYRGHWRHHHHHRFHDDDD